ncbi:MAG: DUF1315 family protein [Halioglobus sp.]
MEYQQLIATMTPDVYQRLLRAVESGKWPDGKRLTERQRGNAMQAIIAWGEQHLPVHERVGYIEKKPQAGDSCDTPQETPLHWKD